MIPSGVPCVLGDLMHAMAKNEEESRHRASQFFTYAQFNAHTICVIAFAHMSVHSPLPLHAE